MTHHFWIPSCAKVKIEAEEKAPQEISVVQHLIVKVYGEEKYYKFEPFGISVLI